MRLRATRSLVRTRNVPVVGVRTRRWRLLRFGEGGLKVVGLSFDEGCDKLWQMTDQSAQATMSEGNRTQMYSIPGVAGAIVYSGVSLNM